jgi:hypothetical protein
MARLRKFFDQPIADRRLLLQAAVLHLVVAGAVRILPFGRVRRILRRVAACDASTRCAPDADLRVVRAVRTVASLLPGANCLTEALVAQCLLGRAGCETTLCFGVSGARPAARPFDAHAWLERAGRGVVIGARAIVYQPFHQPGALS